MAIPNAPHPETRQRNNRQETDEKLQAGGQVAGLESAPFGALHRSRKHQERKEKMRSHSFFIGVKNRNNSGPLKSFALVEAVINGAYQAITDGDEVELEIAGYGGATALNPGDVAVYVSQMNPQWTADFGKQLVLIGSTYVWQ